MPINCGTRVMAPSKYDGETVKSISGLASNLINADRGS